MRKNLSIFVLLLFALSFPFADRVSAEELSGLNLSATDRLLFDEIPSVFSASKYDQKITAAPANFPGFLWLLLKIKIIAEAVDKAKDIPRALKKIVKRSEVLLGLPDPTIYSHKTAKKILLTTFQNRIPFIGPSRAWVMAGALYALEWDFPDIGRQCAELAHRILKGTPVNQIAFQASKTFDYSINLRTAKHMGLTINPELKNGAAQLFR